MSGKISRRSGDIGFRPNNVSTIFEGMSACWFACRVRIGSRLHVGGGGSLLAFSSSSVESSLRNKSQLYPLASLQTEKKRKF